MKYLPLLFILIAMPCWGQDDCKEDTKPSFFIMKLEDSTEWSIPITSEVEYTFNFSEPVDKIKITIPKPGQKPGDGWEEFDPMVEFELPH